MPSKLHEAAIRYAPLDRGAVEDGSRERFPSPRHHWRITKKKGLWMPKMLEGSSLGFEWGENKRQAVLEERRILFRAADGISDGPVLDTLPRHRAETRWAAVGIVDGKAIAVAYMVRDSRRRIITARRARTHEREEHHTNVTGGGKPPQRRDGLGVACDAGCHRCGA